MKKKIIGLLICILVIAPAIPAGEPLKNNAINTTGQSITLESMVGRWTKTQKFHARDATDYEYFGDAVSLDGNTALIASSGVDDNGDAIHSVYVFTRTKTTWRQQAKLSASDGAPYDNFGISVSLSGDTALIGACADDDNGNESGSAYVFTRTGTTWTQQAKLLASDGAEADLFGATVSLSGDTALIGASCDDDDGFLSGSAYVFTRTSTTWTQQQKLTASDGAAWEWFGWSVSLDGDTALIGTGAESAYMFTRTSTTYVFTHTGTTWTQQAKLLAKHGTDLDYFGEAISLDGDIALIGAPAYMQIVLGIGSAYVFTRSGTTWTQHQKLRTLDNAPYNSYGSAVSLENNTALIGAPFDDDKGYYSGSVYVFMKGDKRETLSSFLPFFL
jgi:FG-GAP repeat